MRGQEVELDLVILATGFDSLASAMPFPLVGRGGVTLQQVWGDSPTAYKVLRGCRQHIALAV